MNIKKIIQEEVEKQLCLVEEGSQLSEEIVSKIEIASVEIAHLLKNVRDVYVDFIFMGVFGLKDNREVRKAVLNIWNTIDKKVIEDSRMSVDVFKEKALDNLGNRLDIVDIKYNGQKII